MKGRYFILPASMPASKATITILLVSKSRCMTSVSHSSLDRSSVNAWELLMVLGTVSGEGSNRNNGYFL